MKIVSRVLAKACVVSLSVAFLAAVVGCSEQKSGSMGDNQAAGCQSKCAAKCAEACKKADGAKKCGADCTKACCKKPAQTTAGQANPQASKGCHSLTAKKASGSGCCAKKAKTASAKAGCGAKKAQTASAKAASAGCGSKKGKTAGRKCSKPCGAKGVKVAKCSSDCTKPCCAKKAVSSS